MFNCKYFKSPVARSIPFDNSINGWIAIECQSAIEEARSESFGNDIDTKQFGKQGTISDSYLLTLNNIDSYSSPDFLAYNCLLRKLSFANSNNAGPFDIMLYTITSSMIRTLIYTERFSGYNGITTSEIGINLNANTGIYIRAVSISGIRPADLNIIVWMRQR
jgi:hypothetical protein